jgi:hypothetical protein
VHFFFVFFFCASSVFPVLSFSSCRNPKNLNPRLMLQKNVLHRFPLPVSFWFSSHSSGSSDSSNNHRSFFVIISKEFGQKSKTEMN